MKEIISSYENERTKLLKNYSNEEIAYFEEILRESENYQIQDGIEYKYMISEEGSNG